MLVMINRDSQDTYASRAILGVWRQVVKRDVFTIGTDGDEVLVTAIGPFVRGNQRCHRGIYIDSDIGLEWGRILTVLF
mgnify:CR=1 FL=1